MSIANAKSIEEGTLNFTIESRILRELGERLVKQPEVALLELVKNAYDADARLCEINHEDPSQILIIDDGHGMTLKEFKIGWMRIGTSSKEASPHSRTFGRVITGEKGIGRFAVRFLGATLHLETVAFDTALGQRTVLSADFNWPKFDRNQDLGNVTVPYQLKRAHQDQPVGTRLVIDSLRPNARTINMRTVRTAAIGIVTPYQSLLRQSHSQKPQRQRRTLSASPIDPGFLLRIKPNLDDSNEGDLARTVLDSFVLRCVVELQGDRLKLEVYRKGTATPSIEINDRYENTIGDVYADIRFFPQRKGTFSGLGVDGRRAKTWIKDHSGVAVFDRTFRVHPYGTESDDWLFLSADAAKRAREPRSSLAKKHFPMDDAARMSTQLNYMLRLPYPQQLVGIVQVEGRRTKDQAENEDAGLVASADREGFVDNGAFRRLRDLIRGAVEAIASADRELQQEQERAEQDELLKALRTETQDAIREIQANPNIARGEKARIVSRLAQTQLLAQQHDERSRQREAALETMSLLGVVAGFMTHEFGIAFDELEKAQHKLEKLARRDESFKQTSEAIAGHLARLREFVTYSQGYIKGASSRPPEPYTAKPRIQQVARVFGRYASDRGIVVEVEADRDLLAPLVPVSLYNGIALNLYTNALKAVTAMSGNGPRRIAFRAWNENDTHFLEVSDTGVGVPFSLRQRIFEPLFTTTSTNRDPLGSGMGLGLSLVKRGIEAYSGRVSVVDPPPGFTTCFRVQLPLEVEV